MSKKDIISSNVSIIIQYKPLINSSKSGLQTARLIYHDTSLEQEGNNDLFHSDLVLWNPITGYTFLIDMENLL